MEGTLCRAQLSLHLTTNNLRCDFILFFMLVCTGKYREFCLICYVLTYLFAAKVVF